MLHRLAGFSGSVPLTGHALEFLVGHLEVNAKTDSMGRATKIRQLVATPAIQAVMLSQDQRIRKSQSKLHKLVPLTRTEFFHEFPGMISALRATTASETETITEVAEQAGNLFLGMAAQEQAAHSRAFATWARFLPSRRVEQTFASLAQAKTDDRDQLHLLARLLQRSKSLSLVTNNLKFILEHKLQLPALEGIRDINAFYGSGRTIAGRQVEESARHAVVAADVDLNGIDLTRLSSSAIRLVKFCVNLSSNGSDRLTAALGTVQWTSGSLGRLRPLYREADLEAIESSHPGFFSLAAESALADIAEDANGFLASKRDALSAKVHTDKRLVGSILGLLRESRIAFTPWKLELLQNMSTSAPDLLSAKSILDAAVQWLTPKLTSDGSLSDVMLNAMQALGEYFDLSHSDES